MERLMVGIYRPSITRGRPWALGLLMCAATAGMAAAQTADTMVRLALEPKSRLWLEGSSNLHDWRCDAAEVSTEIRVIRNADAGPATLPSEVAGVIVRVPVTRLRCQNDRMNQNLWKALRANQYPAIEFQMTAADIVADSAGADRVAVAVQGDLALAGTTKPIEFVAVGADAGTGVRITGTAELLMTDFGIKPPTAMLGVLKTRDRVAVRFDLLTSYQSLAALLGAADRTLVARAAAWR